MQVSGFIFDWIAGQAGNEAMTNRKPAMTGEALRADSSRAGSNII